MYEIVYEEKVSKGIYYYDTTNRGGDSKLKLMILCFILNLFRPLSGMKFWIVKYEEKIVG